MDARWLTFPGTTVIISAGAQEFDLATVQAPKKRKADDSNNQDEEQIVPLANERFMVPETLFHPSDIGVNQMGIAEALVHAVRIHPPIMSASILSRACTQRPRPGRSTVDIRAAELQTDGHMTRGGGSEQVNATPASLHPLMYSNVVITGGSANIPGFVER